MAHPFDLIASAHQAKNVSALKVTLAAAQHRVSDAEAMGWTALRDSWQEDVDVIEHLLAIRLEAVAA